MTKRGTQLACCVMLDFHLKGSEFNPETDCGGSAQKLNAFTPTKDKAQGTKKNSRPQCTLCPIQTNSHDLPICVGTKYV